MDLIGQEFLEQDPRFIDLPPCPYHEIDPISEKVTKLTQRIFRMKRIKHRTHQLYYFFLLGKLIETPNLTKFDRMNLRRQISSYNHVIATRIFRIFELNPNQILRTKHLTPRMIHLLKSDEVSDICRTNEFLA